MKEAQLQLARRDNTSFTTREVIEAPKVTLQTFFRVNESTHLLKKIFVSTVYISVRLQEVRKSVKMHSI